MIKLREDKPWLKYRELLVKREILPGLACVTEPLESRKPADPAVVTEIDGTEAFGETKEVLGRST